MDDGGGLHPARAEASPGRRSARGHDRDWSSSPIVPGRADGRSPTTQDLRQPHRPLRHRRPAGRRRPHRPQDHRGHLRRQRPATAAAHSPARTPPRWTARRPTRRAGWPRTWWPRDWPTAARCRSPMPSAWRSPVSVMVETFGTEPGPGRRISERAVARGLRPAPRLPSSDDLDLRRPIYRKTGGLRPLRPRASRVHLGEDRPRRRPAGGLRGRVTWLRLSRRGDARHSDSLRQSSLATPSVGGDLGRPLNPGMPFRSKGLTKVSPYGSSSKTPSFIIEKGPGWGPFAVSYRVALLALSEDRGGDPR